MMSADTPLDLEQEYKHDLHHLKLRYKTRIDVYASEEHKMIKQRLQKIVGEVRASEIMNNHIF